MIRVENAQWFPGQPYEHHLIIKKTLLGEVIVAKYFTMYKELQIRIPYAHLTFKIVQAIYRDKGKLDATLAYENIRFID